MEFGSSDCDRINHTQWRQGTFYQIDLKIIWPVWSKGICLLFIEDIGTIPILLWDREQVLLGCVQGIE